MLSPKTIFVLSLLIALAGPAEVVAQSAGGDAEAAFDPTGSPSDNYHPLSLDQAIAIGVQNNLDVEVSRYSPYVSELESGAAWGSYDPVFSGQVGYAGASEENTFELDQVAVSKNYSVSGEAGITALVPYWGGSVFVNFDSGRATTNSTIQNYSPEYESGLELGASVPLLRGLVWNEPWTQVKQTHLAYGASIDDFSTSVMDTVFSIIGSYWDLVAQREQVRVATKSLTSTKALLEQTEIQYQVGVVSRVEVVQAEAGVANSEYELIVARNDYRNTQDDLIAKVLGNRLRPTTDLLFQPTDNPEFTRVSPVDLEKAVTAAFQNRPELAAAQKRIEQQEVQLKFAKNQRLPKLDIDFRYRTLGITGDKNNSAKAFFGGAPKECGTGPDDLVCGDYGDTFHEYWDNNHEISAMGIISIPLGNTRARKQVSQARLELRKANSQVTRLRQIIIKDVRASSRGLLAAAQGVEAAERRRVAAAEQLRAETIRLEYGESTPFDVLQRERDLVDAQSQKIDALRAFRISQAKLERDQGTILEARNVSIQGVRALGNEN
ncbi:MAG: TolC family protein [Myxococcota bacterium]